METTWRKQGREEEESRGGNTSEGSDRVVMERQGRTGKEEGSESVGGGSLEERIRGRQRGEWLSSDHPVSPCPSLL